MSNTETLWPRSGLSFPPSKVSCTMQPSSMRVMLFEPFWTSPSFGPGHAAVHSPTQKLSCFCSGASHGFGGAATGVACCAKLVDQFVEKLADKQISRTGRSRIMQSPLPSDGPALETLAVHNKTPARRRRSASKRVVIHLIFGPPNHRSAVRRRCDGRRTQCCRRRRRFYCLSRVAVHRRSSDPSQCHPDHCSLVRRNGQRWCVSRAAGHFATRNDPARGDERPRRSDRRVPSSAHSRSHLPADSPLAHVGRNVAVCLRKEADRAVPRRHRA